MVTDTFVEGDAMDPPAFHAHLTRQTATGLYMISWPDDGYGKLYFSASNGRFNNGTELWVTDGLPTGTYMVADIQVGTGSSTPSKFLANNGKLYFVAYEGRVAPARGSELWVYDGVNPPSIVADIRPGTGSSSPNYLMPFGGEIIFSANDGTNLMK